MNKYVLKFNKEDFLLYFVVIDILFLPYVRVLHVSISMLLFPFWFAANLKNLNRRKEFTVSVMFLSLGLVSLLVGSIMYTQLSGSILTDYVILFFSILYYLFFSEHIKKQQYNFGNIFFVLMVFATLMAVFYRISPQGYFNIRANWSMSGTAITYVDGFYNRFTFIESDPNSIGSILSAMMIYILLIDHQMKKWKKYLSVALTGIVVIITISATALIVYIGSIVICILFSKWKVPTGRMSRIGLAAISSIAVAAVLFLLYARSRGLFQVNTLEYISTRVGTNISSGTMSGRTIIWADIIRTFDWGNYIIVGRGKPISAAGILRKTHNGHLHMILSYGFIAYVLFLYIFFRKKKNQPLKKHLPLIPLFLLFSVNTVISDYRALMAFSLLAAICHFEGNKQDISQKNFSGKVIFSNAGVRGFSRGERLL